MTHKVQKHKSKLWREPWLPYFALIVVWYAIFSDDDAISFLHKWTQQQCNIKQIKSIYLLGLWKKNNKYDSAKWLNKTFQKKKKKAIMHKNRKDSKYVPAFWQVWYTRINENEVRMVKAGVNIIIHDRRVTPTSMTRCSCTINGFPIVTKTYILSP